jgi:hypothetical protein
MRDTQRQAVYSWEHEAERAHPPLARRLTFEECRAYIARVWNDYRPGTEPPKLGDGRGRSNACGSRWSIKLPAWARKPSTLLHEVAHALTGLHSEAAHGSIFARLTLELFVHYEGAPAAKLRALAIHQKPRRVRFAAVALCPKRRPVAWQRWHKRLDELLAEIHAHRSREPKGGA